MYVQQSSILLQAHSDVAPCIHLNSCTGKRAIKRNSIAFVDDTAGQTSAKYGSPKPIDEAVTKLQKSAQIWNELVTLTGGSLALHKTHWQILAWKFIKGEATLVTATDKVIVIEDSHGAISVIDYMRPVEPNEGLGFRCCPDGNMKHTFTHIKTMVQDLCRKVAAAHLTKKNSMANTAPAPGPKTLIPTASRKPVPK